MQFVRANIHTFPEQKEARVLVYIESENRDANISLLGSGQHEPPDKETLL